MQKMLLQLAAHMMEMVASSTKKNQNSKRLYTYCTAFAYFIESRYEKLKILKQGDNGAAKIIRKKTLNEQAEYRLSLYIYLFAENDRYLIRHLLTCEITELTETEMQAVQQIQKAPVPYSFIKENGLEQLAEKRYIVETSYNELKQYQQTVFLLKTMAGSKKGLGSYTILPTTGCNARCVYCYEEGYAVRTMTIETADRLIDFICETKHDDAVKLRWFGGEPTAASHIIRHICKGLQERNVPFKSSMVTNASLITKELAHEMQELWHLQKVQVSLDGAKEDYTIRKNYFNPEKHNYDVVMQAVQFLLDEGIHVQLRVNVDFDNLERMPAFIQEMQERFSGAEHLTMYIVPLYQAEQSDRCIEVYKEIFRLTDMQREIGIPQSEKAKDKTHTAHLKLNFCMADNLKKSIVITPDGIFNNCEHLPEKNTWGNIFDGITSQEKYKELCTTPEIDKACAECPFLPECTPFHKKGCPGYFKKCREYRCLRTEYVLHRLLQAVNIESDDVDEEI